MSANAPPNAPARRVAELAAVLRSYHERYDTAHDARAVFAYTYWALTDELARTLAAPDPGFHDPEWVADIAEAFGARYVDAMDAIDEWTRTAPDNFETLYATVPRPWADVYRAICHQPSTVVEDLVFPMGTHISYDLPYALLDVGLDPEQLSDYHRMNEVLASNTDALQTSVVERYDPLLSRFDRLAGEADELFTDYWIRVGRSMAWYNAARIESPRSRSTAEESIARTTAALIESVRPTSPRPVRWKGQLVRRLLKYTRRWPASSEESAPSRQSELANEECRNKVKISNIDSTAIKRTSSRNGDRAELSTDLERLRHLPEGPLKMAKLTLWWLRKTIFTKPKPDNPALFVPLSEPELVELFGTEYFEPGWEISYSYRNETLNLRRVEYVPDHPLGFEWWQVHIRGYRHVAGDRFDEETFELAVHFELEPTEYPQSHVDKVGLELDRGVMAVREIFDTHGIPYEYLHPDGSPVKDELESAA